MPWEGSAQRRAQGRGSPGFRRVSPITIALTTITSTGTRND